MTPIEPPELAAFPDCPHCGCNAVRVVGRGRVRFGRLVRCFRCDHCASTWTERENWPTKLEPVPAFSTRPELGPDRLCPPPTTDPPPVPAPPPPPPDDVSPGGAVRYHVVRCPKCQSDRTKITSTQRPVRYHKCKACGHTFKSVEQTQESE